MCAKAQGPGTFRWAKKEPQRKPVSEIGIKVKFHLRLLRELKVVYLLTC